MGIYNKVYFVLAALALLSYIFTYRRHQGYAKMVILYLALGLILTATAIYMGVVLKKTNLFLFHIALPLEFIIISLLYKNAMTNRTMKKLIVVSMLLFLVMHILFSAFVEKLDKNNSYMVIVESMMVTFYSLFFLRETLLLQRVTVLHRYPMFWISVGIMFYFVGILLIEGLFNYMLSRSNELLANAYKFEYLLKYIASLLLIVGAFCNTTWRSKRVDPTQ